MFDGEIIKFLVGVLSVGPERTINHKAFSV